MKTETKHTRGEMQANAHGCDVLLTENGGHSVGLIYRQEEAARLVAGWNLLNRLDEMGGTPEQAIKALTKKA